VLQQLTILIYFVHFNCILNFYLVIEVPDHVYVFYAYRLYFADKDIYIIRYFYHKIEIVRVF